MTSPDLSGMDTWFRRYDKKGCHSRENGNPAQ